MGKSTKLEVAKTMLQIGAITTYEQLADYLPYTTVAKLAHIGKDRMKLILYQDALEMKVEDLCKIAKVLGVSVETINDLVIEKVEQEEKKRKTTQG